MALEVGSRLGHYDVTALIGEGGMGQVYQATDTKLNRQVALKILPEAFAEDPDRLARFQREAQVLASLNHPGIAAIYGVEESGDTRALVLELVEGPTLADRIKQGPIPVDEALPIAKQIAEALEAAHEAGVIHRDLKPANIKVRDDGTVKVLDFGLAKALDTTPEGDPSQSPTLTAAATQMGVIMGTAAYMSPEQARGKPVDRRADIWSFGVVLLEMLTGRKVFEGEDVSMTLSSVLQREPDWSHLPSAVSPSISVFLHRCLEKDQKQRVHDVADVRLALEGAFETAVSAPAEPLSLPQLQVWQRPVPLALAALGIAAMASLAVWSLTRPSPPLPGLVSRFQIPLAADQNFSGTGRRVVAISPDGSQILHTANNSLWLRPVDQLGAVQVSGTEEAWGPFFSADGQSAGFYADGQLKRVSVRGGAPVTVADGVRTTFGASWGTDDMILYGQPDGIWQVPGASGTPQLLIPADEGENFYGPQMLPGDEWVLFTAGSAEQSWDEAQIVAESVATNERTVLIDGGRDARYLSTGHLIYGLNNVLLAVPFDVDAREVTGRPVPLVEEVREARLGNTGALQFSISTNGSLVYVPGSADGERVVSLTWVDRDGAEESIQAPSQVYVHPRVSPDGTRVAVAITDRDNRDIWIWNLAEERPTQLTFDEGTDDVPLWTPDGARVVFGSTRDGGGLYWKAADGTGQVEWLKDGLARPYAWASDGRLIFQQGTDIGVLTMEGERTVEMVLDAEYAEREPVLSPDGRWLAYVSSEDGSRIYVRPFPNVGDGGPWEVSREGGVSPVWSPDGRELFYRRGSTAMMVAQVETAPTFSSRTPEPLFSLSGYVLSPAGDTGRKFDIAPDGRFIFPTPATADQTGDEPFNGLIFVENWFQELTERVPID